MASIDSNAYKNYSSETPYANQRTNNSENHVKRLSGITWVDRVMSIHQRARNEMPQDMPPFLMPKKPDYFKDLLTGKTGALFGIFVDTKLVGMTALLITQDFDTALKTKTLTCPAYTGGMDSIVSTSNVGVIQSVCILDSHKNRGLCSSLIKEVSNYALQNNCLHLYAQVASGNDASLRMFAKQGFKPVTKWINGHERVLVHKEQVIECPKDWLRSSRVRIRAKQQRRALH